MARTILPVLALLVTTANAAEPLHVRIDKIIDAAQIGAPTQIASDSAFVRRVYLNLTGVIPSSEEARRFLDDKSPNKRQKLIDQLLSSSRYVRHLSDSLNLMLMERRTNAADWLAFLNSSVEQNKPWNQLASEILGTDGTDAKTKGAMQFFTTRNVEANLMTRDIGRIFFGMDLECAQCHDHPRIDDYFQRDYYGIYAFLNRTYLFRPNKKKPAILAEKAVGNVNFKSVFTSVSGMTRPRLPGGIEIVEPTLKKGDEYKVKPNKKNKSIRPVPRFSRREQLQKLVLKGENPAFRRNIANRLWLHVMGRGIVHPPDLLHSENPPSHPELLDLLADELAKMKFDMKAFIRELTLTRTYQRSAALPSDLSKQAKDLQPRLAMLKSEKKKLTDQELATSQAISKITSKQKPGFRSPELTALRQKFRKQTVARQVVDRRIATIEAIITYAQTNDAEEKKDASDALTKLWSEQFVLASLSSLTPEQLGWSVLEATGQVERYRKISSVAIDRKKTKKELREKLIEADVHAKLKRNVDLFVKLFGLGAGQPQYDFFATAEQALFFANSSQVQSWLAPSRDSLTFRLNKIAEPEKLAEEMYLSVLTRRPTQQEITDVKEYLASRPSEKSNIVRDMVWALLTSSEFRFHH